LLFFFSFPLSSFREIAIEPQFSPSSVVRVWATFFWRSTSVGDFFLLSIDLSANAFVFFMYFPPTKISSVDSYRPPSRVFFSSCYRPSLSDDVSRRFSLTDQPFYRFEDRRFFSPLFTYRSFQPARYVGLFFLRSNSLQVIDTTSASPFPVILTRCPMSLSHGFF